MSRTSGLAAILAVVFVLAGCGDSRPPPPSMADEPGAAEVIRKLDSDLRQLAALGPAQRAEVERSFGARLRHDLDICRGTRHENKPLYLLAQWTMVQGGPEAPVDVLRLLDRLDILPAPSYRNAGRALRVQALLRVGRLAEARAIAVALEDEVPEFGALRRVEFHELVGQQAPPLPGLTVGGAVPPDNDFVLVAFIGMPDVQAGTWITPLREASQGDRVRIVAVATGGDMLAAATAAGSWGVEVRWLRPGDPAIAAWRVPGVPAAVLLGPGPQRLVLAVDPLPADLARLAAAQP